MPWVKQSDRYSYCTRPLEYFRDLECTSELNTRTQQKQVRVNTGQHSYYHVSCETEIPQVSPTMKVYKSIVASNTPFSLRMWSFPVSLDGSPTQWRKLVEESWERRNDGGDKHIHSTV